MTWTKCDECSAEALIEVMHPRLGHTLDFCGHHYAKRMPALSEQGFTALVSTTNPKEPETV